MRLTAKEKELLRDAAQFVLAGEWPWEEGTERQQDRDRECLKRAVEKLSAVTPEVKHP